MAGKIFINYRRGDDPGNTGRLFDRLQESFSAERLFMDVDSIAPGLDFVRVLEEHIALCDALLAVIGPRWLESTDQHGRRRLDDPGDLVRVEIESALKQGKLVIPVLMGDTAMPLADQLPEAIRPLARRNGVRLRHERFRADAQDLVKALERALDEAEAARQGATARSVAAAPDDGRASTSTSRPPVSPPLAASTGRDTAGRRTSGTRPFNRKTVVAAVVAVAAVAMTVAGLLLRKPNETTAAARLAPVPAEPTPTERPARKAAPLVVADGTRQAWLSGGLTGHYHEQAASARVLVRQNGGQYRLFLDAPQAKFDCALDFGSDGRPKSASACQVVKYDYAGRVQTDVHWWTDDVIAFKCVSSGQKEVCRGSYTLHYGRGDRNSDDSPAEKRTMRIERSLTKSEG